MPCVPQEVPVLNNGRQGVGRGLGSRQMPTNPYIAGPGERGETLPQTNPETPPDTTDPRGPCPRCGNRAGFEIVGSLPVSYRRRGPGTEEIDRVSALVCASCNQGVVVVEEKWIGDHPVKEEQRGGGHQYWRGVFWWPAPGAADLSDAIPAELQEAFIEGVRSHGGQSPHAAAVMFRRTVEGIVRDKGSEEAIKQLDNNDLPGALLHMHKAGILDKTLYEWGLEIRALGNTGGHFDAFKNVSPEQADELLALVRQLLRYIYEEPDRIRRLRESRGVSG